MRCVCPPFLNTPLTLGVHDGPQAQNSRRPVVKSARLSVGPGEECYVHSTFSTFLLLFEQGVPDFHFALDLANYVAGSG